MHRNIRLPFSVRRAFLLLVPAAIALLAACTPGNPQSTFGAEGPVAREQAELFIIIFWVALVILVLVEGALIYSTIKFRRRDTRMPRQVHGNTKLEVTWTIIPALILVVIAVPTIQGILYQSDPPDGQEPLEVVAIGHQWWFEFRYPGEAIITANELHVPSGRPVRVTLDSQDVIHSFWIPKLAGKVDMVPNNDNHMWFLAEEPAEAGADPVTYFGQCAEFCGFAHAMMRFRVIAHAPEDFDAWVNQWHTPPDPPAPGSPEADGGLLFATHCSTCHTVDTYRPGGYGAEIDQQAARWDAWTANPQGARIVSAPNLTQFGTRTTIGAGVDPLTQGNLVAWVQDPSSIKEGTRMQEHAAIYQTPDNHAGLQPEEVQAIAAFLMSLQPGEGGPAPTPGPLPGDPVERGQQVFQISGCNGCHSTGTDRIVGPGLQGVYARAGERRPNMTAEQYITESVQSPSAYIVEGFDPAMPPFNLSDQEIGDLIAYLRTLE